VKQVKYVLEIYEPGNVLDKMKTIESSSPIYIATGDFIAAGAWEGFRVSDRFQVVAVDHGIWEVGDVVIHKLMVYTKRIVADTVRQFYDIVFGE